MKLARLIAWLLMLTLPLQSLAALVPSTCSGAHAGEAALAADHSLQSHHGTAVQSHAHPADFPQHDDGQPADQANSHSGCHHVFSVSFSTVASGTPAPPLAVIPRISLLTTLHIPEQPLRPPRA